jgi:hypothetical protein
MYFFIFLYHIRLGTTDLELLKIQAILSKFQVWKNVGSLNSLI